VRRTWWIDHVAGCDLTPQTIAILGVNVRNASNLAASSKLRVVVMSARAGADQTRHYLGSLESAGFLGAILGDPLDLSI